EELLRTGSSCHSIRAPPSHSERESMASRRPPLREALAVRPGAKVRLGSIDPGETHGRTKAAAASELTRGLDRLTDLQDRLWAEQKHPILIVLQGIDTAGKDGTINHVMSAFNPMGCTVTSWKAPTPIELAHHYLWRIHQRTPGKGEIAIFNRSHYEDVLVVPGPELGPNEVSSRAVHA